MESLARRPRNILRLLDTIGKENDIFSNLFDSLSHFHGYSPFRGIDNPNFSPSLDIVEKPDKYAVTLEVPGIEKDGIQIEIENDRLTIKGEKKSEKKEETDEVFVCERCYGAFRREIPLPNDSDADNINASYSNGILTLEIPKTKVEEKAVRKIEIK